MGVRSTLLTRHLKRPGDGGAFPSGGQVGEPAAKEIKGSAER